MEIRNGFSFRTAIRAWGYVVALGCFSLSAHAQSDFGDKIWWKADGASWVPDYNKSAAFPSKATPLGGALVVNGAGIVHGPAEWPKASARSGIPGVNKSAPIDVVARFKPSSVAGAFGRLASKVGPVASVVALVTFAADIGYIIKDSTTPGGAPVVEKLPVSDPTYLDTYEYQYADSGWHHGAMSACSAWIAAFPGFVWTNLRFVAPSTCQAERRQPQFPDAYTQNQPISRRTQTTTPPPVPNEPSSVAALTAAIASASGWPSEDRIGPAIAEALRLGEVIETDPAVVSGPASSPVTSSTTTNPDGSVSTTNKTHNYTYNGPKVTVTTTTTTTTVNPATGTTETTTTVDTETPPPTPPVEEEQKNQCELTPNALGCAELDTPTQEIPRDTETIDFQEENVFGSGSCPANLTATIATLGQSVTVWDWSKTCELALPLRALVLGLASFAALLIVMPGGNKT